MTFDALLTNLRHASTNWWKEKKNKNLITFTVVVYGTKSFLSKESDTMILQSIYFAYDVGIISSYSNRISIVPSL